MIINKSFLIYLPELRNALKAYLLNGLRKAGSRDLRDFLVRKYSCHLKDMPRKYFVIWVATYKISPDCLSRAVISFFI